MIAALPKPCLGWDTQLLRWQEPAPTPPPSAPLSAYQWPSFVSTLMQDLLALLTDSGFLSILRYDAALCRWVPESCLRVLCLEFGLAALLSLSHLGK